MSESEQDELFGWDLLYGSIRNTIESNDDILLAFTHLVLVKEGFKCIGVGESTVLSGDENKSESLPDGWQAVKALRYVLRGKLYNLKAVLVDDGIMINLIRPDERTVSMVHFQSNAVAQRDTAEINAIIPSYAELRAKIRSDLITKVAVSNKSRDQDTQTNTSSDSSSSHYNPHGVGSGGFFQPLGSYPLRVPNRHEIPPRIGGADLDPFNGIFTPGNPFRARPDGSAGGMLYVPPQLNRPSNPALPPGAVPPGARFDPFRPPDPDQFPPMRRLPNPDDEFGPPGWDDMYM